MDTSLSGGGREDQALLLLHEGDAPQDPRAGAAEIFRSIGAEPTPASDIPLDESDVWLWRAGRTNDHPIPQYVYPGWALDRDTGIPEPLYIHFQYTAGFAEDLFVDASGALARDQGLPPYVRNFPDTTSVPIRICKDPYQVLPCNWAMWWPLALRFGTCQTIATTRSPGTEARWSENLYASGQAYDWMFGWALQVPTESAADVRARGRHVVSGNGNGWTLEWRRQLDTGNPDDVRIDPISGTYWITIGIADDSGDVIRVSRAIRLVFSPAEAPKAMSPRC